MSNKEKEQVLAAARKVCDSSCIASYNCGKTKAAAGNLPLCGTNTVCPLLEYDIQHDSEKKTMLERLQYEPTLDDLAILCEHCNFRDKSKDTEDEFSMENCFFTHCIDCPVGMCRDGIEETMAEARMS